MRCIIKGQPAKLQPSQESYADILQRLWMIIFSFVHCCDFFFSSLHFRWLFDESLSFILYFGLCSFLPGFPILYQIYAAAVLAFLLLSYWLPSTAIFLDVKYFLAAFLQFCSSVCLFS